MKREFFGGDGRPGISTVMVEAFNIMQDRITRAASGWRSAGCPDLAARRQDRLVRFHRARK
jgi:NTE family protein